MNPARHVKKPSVADLLFASGYTLYTQPLVLRAVDALYANVGIHLDERDWSEILRGGRALSDAEAALLKQYQDSGYLLRNTQHLVQSGYTAEQAEIAYRQMADRLGYTHNAAWCVGTPYSHLAGLSLEELIALAPQQPALPQPIVSVLKAASGQAVTVTLGGQVILTVGVPLAR